MRSIQLALLLPFCLPSLGALARAQAASPVRAVAAAETPSTDDAAVEKRRVIHLASGQSIRVVSRFAEGRWEYKNKNGWKTLEPGSVVSTALESDLLREWRTKRDATNLKKSDERAALAAWAATAGLMLESLQEIDAVLAVEPDNKAALEILSRTWFFTVPSLQVAPDALPAAEEELLRFGASQSPAGRELAAMELARHPDKDALRKRIGSELRSTVVTRRSFAALAMRRVFPGEGVKPLIARAVLDSSAEVRKGCALALKAANEPGLCVPIVKALGSQSPIVRANAAEALGDMGYVAAVEPLVTRLAAAVQSGGGDRLPHSNIFIGRQFAYIQDFDVEVAQFQAVADPQVNVLIEGSVLDTAVGGVLEVGFAEESRAIQGSLSKLTKENPGHSANAWLAWWDKNGPKWRSDELSRPKTGDTAAAQKG
jgi:hypothetical protein